MRSILSGGAGPNLFRYYGLAFLGCFAWAWVLAPSVQAEPAGAGVWVDSVEARSLAEKSGLRPGDHLTGWRREALGWANPLPAGGLYETPFEFEEVLIEQAARGGLTLLGEREGENRTWALQGWASAGGWGLEVRPFLSRSLQELYERGEASFVAAEATEGAESWRHAALLAFERLEPDAALWLLDRRARELERRREHALVDGAFAESVEAERWAGRKIAAALTLSRWAKSFWLRARWEEAVQRSAESVRVAGDLSDRPLLSAELAYGEAETLRQANRMAPAEELYRQVLKLRRAEAPGGLAEAEALYGLGRVLSAQWKSNEAGPLLQGAGLIQRTIARDSAAYVQTLLALSVVYRDQNQVGRAESVAFDALLRSRSLGGTCYDEGRAMYLLSLLAKQAGDLPRVSELSLAARRCFEASPTDSLSRRNLAGISSTLSWYYFVAGEPELARQFGESAVEMEASLHPGSIEVAQALDSLGISLMDLKPKVAASYFSTAIAIKEKLIPKGPEMSRSLALLGGAQLSDGSDLEDAERTLRRALTACPTCSFSYALSALALAAEQEGRYEEALKLVHRQIEVAGPATIDNLHGVSSLHQLGRLEKRMGWTDASREHLCQVAKLLDLMGDRLTGGSTARAGFYARYSYYYPDCLASLFSAAQWKEAFQLLESSRARSFLDMVATRDLAAEELPSDLSTERSRIRSSLEATLADLAGARSTKDLNRVETLQGQLAEFHRAEEILVERFRRESPRYASLHHPQPIDLAGARAALDAGTILLAYVVGREESFLFVVRPDSAPGPGLAAVRLALAEERLRDEIDALRKLQADSRSNRAELNSRSRHLYSLLIAPIEKSLAGADRLLIAPDGPLHGLPFSSLVRPDGRYLIEWKPVHTVLSATVYAEIKKLRRPEAAAPHPLRLAAFGDPSYPQFTTAKPEEASDLRLRSALRRGLTLTPLPSSRREVEALKAIYPGAEIFVGKEASEEKAKNLGKEVKIIHFAGHALLDERSPLDSSLALSIPESVRPGEEDGLLQSWEIFEQVRLDADLVTLSACNTALGKEMGGEGLVGLSRAFLFAGARSVLASLWAVGDRSTARFMPRFYQHLRSGLTKDEALRRTQIEWLRDPKTAHPFHWAAFQLIGDYR